MEGELTLTFIDHVEKKEAGPARQKVLSPKKVEKSIFEEAVTKDMNGNPDIGDSLQNSGSDTNDIKSDTKEVTSPQDTSPDIPTHIKDEEAKLLEELHLSESSIGMENKVQKSVQNSEISESVSKPLEDSGFVEVKGSEKNLQSGTPEKKATTEASTYEFTSASSMFLTNEKVIKDTDNTEHKSCEDKLNQNLMSPLSLQTEMVKQSLETSCPQPTSDDLNLTFEEDDEKVVIHLEKELEKNTREIPTNPVEVERKFKVTADTKIKLLEIGAELHKEKVFIDRYFDSPDYSLTLKDCWLRQRNGSWELKVVAGTMANLSSQYKEISTEEEINSYLLTHFQRPDLRKAPIDSVVKSLGLTIFVEYTTTRQTYFLPECTIDLDLTDFGYQVGEIEVMAADGGQVAQALDTIDSVAKKLGFETFQLMEYC